MAARACSVRVTGEAIGWRRLLRPGGPVRVTLSAGGHLEAFRHTPVPAHICLNA